MALLRPAMIAAQRAIKAGFDQAFEAACFQPDEAGLRGGAAKVYGRIAALPESGPDTLLSARQAQTGKSILTSSSHGQGLNSEVCHGQEERHSRSRSRRGLVWSSRSGRVHIQQPGGCTPGGSGHYGQDGSAAGAPGQLSQRAESARRHSENERARRDNDKVGQLISFVGLYKGALGAIGALWRYGQQVVAASGEKDAAASWGIKKVRPTLALSPLSKCFMPSTFIKM